VVIDPKPGGLVSVHLDPAAHPHPQGYRLEITPSHISIAAPAPAASACTANSGLLVSQS